MRPALLFLSASLAFLSGLVLLGLVAVLLSFSNHDEAAGCLDRFLGSLLTGETLEWPLFAPALANYAFFHGILLSWGWGGRGGGGGGVLPAVACRTASPELDFSRCLVGAAFRQGYARRFAWPPQSVVIVLASPGESCLPNEQLTRRVRPVATTVLGLPLLLVLALLFVVCAGLPLSVLVRRLYRTAAGPLASRLTRVAVCGCAGVHRGVQAVLAAAVRAATPVVFGAMAVVTTAMGFVLFGMARAGLDALAASGVFGLNEAAVATLLELIDAQWRLLQEINWSWWVTAMEERHGHKRDGRDAHREHHHHHDCFDLQCPFSGGGEKEGHADHNGHGGHAAHSGFGLYRREATDDSDGTDDADDVDNVDNEGGNDAESAAGQNEKKPRRPVHVHHHHHHHFHHHDERGRPGWRQRWFWWWIFVQRRRELLGERKGQDVQIHKHRLLEAQAWEMLFCDCVGHRE